MESTWRRKICHWMFETGKAFELAKDTVGCAIHFMDQYLSVLSVDKIMLQLLSMVCMYVASKMHESQPISMDEMDLLSQRKFSRQDICAVESKLLQVLGWRLTPPTSFTFARDFIQILDIPDKHELETQVLDFLQDVTGDLASLRFKNSSIGISAVQVVWNARRLRKPSTVVKDAIHSLKLNTVPLLSKTLWQLPPTNRKLILMTTFL
uniref:Cyclin-like domain-containing protein n=1 Tax=Globisporangium ultimum (strain ATCC 200006 / CBS 805.95 / DAOM BR144) TaxID=431595 RepID=K3WZ67_GLOUD